MTAGPKIVEDYQRKLEAFLTDLPDLPQQINSGTPSMPNPTSEKIEHQKKPENGGISSNPLFTKYTGYTHEGLLRKWLFDRTTTCNEFVGRCAGAMGVPEKKGVGRFDIADWLARSGLSHCWVPADSGATPVYGDVFRMLGDEPDHNGVRRNHMAVVLYIDGKTLHSADGGQGGPSTGYDVIRRVSRTWKPDSLRGWVSIKALLNSSQPLRGWVGGWWEVFQEPYETWYYHFGANGKVACSSRKPPSPTAPPMANAYVGSFAMKGMFEATISWNNADADESLTFVVVDQEKRKYRLVGKTAQGVKLEGKRILVADVDL